MRLWAREGFYLQHFYALRVEAYCDLYDGRPAEAWERLLAAWPQIKRSGFLRHALLRTDVYTLRARISLALAHTGARDRSRLLRRAERDARRLAREGRPDAVATARLLRAGVAKTRGARELSLELLDDAIARYEKLEMVLQAAAAKRRKGELQGGSEGGALAAEAEASLRDRGIRNPSRWLALVAPSLDA
jgi:hypothetical protein